MAKERTKTLDLNEVLNKSIERQEDQDNYKYPISLILVGYALMFYLGYLAG